ncbi:MAG: hypothetical protein P4L90_25755 [Rhodopila sp.]|nr:hypothetical protein [Rhodopila sp.]
MKRLWVIAAISVTISHAAEAQAPNAASQVVTGYWASSGCPNNAPLCFIQYGPGGGSSGSVTTKPTPLTIVPLDASSVTGATTVLTTGHATAGGFLVTANAAGICVDQQTAAGTVTGTPSSTVCVPQNTPFQLVPNSHAVSVNSTASGVAVGGEGLQ